MTELFHICYSSHNEVLFRDSNDYLFARNSLALSLYATNSKLICYALMSDHIHLMLLSDNPSAFMKVFRLSVTKHFNSRYFRKGRLGEKKIFCNTIVGVHHATAVASYILRNPIHHGVCTTSFAYPFSSINCYFTKDLHVKDILGIKQQDLLPETCRRIPRNYLPQNGKIPSHYKLTPQGIILPESFVEIVIAENYFTTARRFLYHLNRVSDEEWSREQEKDTLPFHEILPPITLETIENKRRYNISELLSNERGHFKPIEHDDMVICEYIDNKIVPRFRKKAYTQLTLEEKQSAAKELKSMFHIKDRQIKRCLAM
ncbi:MAG: hypothetical protein PHD11_00300 [Bacteroidales bacterium]|nr:hypothetical protein [Bacteroidales bacterium]MDD4670605.1 hypothetical protein [Bacteroidales bacterium]